MKLVIAISGASGAELGVKFLNYLPKYVTPYIIISESAKKVLKFENKKYITFDNSQIEASISSGSFGVDATAIIPCSMNTLAKIACGISDNLITRVAAVALKEQKRLLLAPREMPLSAIALSNMQKLASLGVVISPPILGYYANINSLEDLEKFIIGKWYDSLGIEHNLFKRWEGK